jgi:farnesyl diphosphate synthase
MGRTYAEDQNLYANTPGGKLNRGLSVVDTVEILKGSALTDDEYLKSAILGWCVELVRPSQLSRQVP